MKKPNGTQPGKGLGAAPIPAFIQSEGIVVPAGTDKVSRLERFVEDMRFLKRETHAFYFF